MSDEKKIRDIIKREYSYDVEAIRNLGAISKSILTGKNYHNLDSNVVPGKLVIPANVKIQGSVEIEGKVDIKDQLTCQKRLEVNCGEFWNTDASATYTTSDGQTHSIKDKYIGTVKPKAAIILDCNNCRFIPKIASWHPDKKLQINTLDTARESLFLGSGTYAQLPHSTIEMFGDKTRITNELIIAPRREFWNRNR